MKKETERTLRLLVPVAVCSAFSAAAIGFSAYSLGYKNGKKAAPGNPVTTCASQKSEPLPKSNFITAKP